MPLSSSRNRSIERVQPWLGTFCSIRLCAPPEIAQPAMEDAFRAIAAVHRHMSFHDRESDLSCLNQHGADHPVSVHPDTWEVLRFALDLSAASEGSFDVSVARELVAWNLLPPPDDTPVDLSGTWRDIALLPNHQVFLHRPLWVDLGGIAKGFAVDRAIEQLEAHGIQSAVVNGGGDLRVLGDAPEQIALETEVPLDPVPVVTVSDGSVASSSGHLQRRGDGARTWGPHVNPRTRGAASTSRFVCVAAEHCMAADALTKVVMNEGAAALPVLQSFNASAYFFDPGLGWTTLN